MEENIRKTEEHLSKVSLENQNKDSRSTCELSEDDQDIFTALITNAKQLTTEGNIKDALDLYKQALKMYYNEKLERKIHKMEAYLQKTDDNSARRGSTPLQKSKPEIRATPQEEISDDNQEIYNQMISSARQMVNEGKIRDALEINKEALKIYYNEKLAKKITKMEMYLKESGEGEVQGRSGEGQGQGRSRVEDTPKQVSTGISTEDKEIFDQLIQSARQYTDQGKIKDALELYREAIKINDNEKLAKKIAKMEQYLKEAGGEQVQKNIDDERKSQEPCSKEESKPEVPSETPKKTVVNQQDQETYKQLIETAKQCTDEGNLKDALDLYQEALKIYNSEKLAKKIVKIETYLKENDYSNRENKNQESMESKDSKTQVSQAPIKSEIMQDDQEKFNKLVTQAKKLISDGQVREALKMNKEALEIYHSDKLAKKITKMEQYLKEHGNDDEVEEDENGMVHVGNGYFMYKELYDKLYDHQKEAVLWMWGLHKKRKGGILGDDMGLGKTIQIISFLSGLFDMDKVHAAIIVMPVSLIINWEKEFKTWAPGIRVTAYHGSSKKEKERVLSKVQRRGGVILTSYGLVVTSWELLGKQDGREFVWDYMILDEGHKIKNPTKTTKGVHAVPARNRIILTGTPIQNNLKELWALFDFVHQGALLGTARTFKMEYENPITRARERDATAGERKLGQEMAESLKKIMAPYFLRRTKAEVTETKIGVNVKSEDEGAGKMPSLTRKNDLILWVFLTQTQQKIYHDFLSLETVKELLMTKKSPLVALTVLKKITDHPRLLSTRAVAQLGLDDHGLDEDQLESEVAYQSAVNQIKNVEDQTLINESGKLIVLVELLDKLKEEGHRTLVFSQSRKLLDIIDKVITGRGHKVMRLDGTITHLSERDQRMKKFHSDDRYSVFLLTTQVGGVGLTLTAADRVVIYDPSWNPATDAQAVDRAFRIGQEKNVVIYRLITCGTVEEKIYRRQIFKDSITRQTTGNTKNPHRYFTKQELRELFQLDSPRVSSTQQQLEQMHSGYRKTDESLDAHIAYLYSLDIFGISDHDLMFGEIKDNKGDIDEEYKQEDSHLNGNDYIQARVQKAQERIKMESDLSQPMSHYPSAEGQSNRPRGLQEWNMPNGLPQPSGGPDNVVDMTTADDSDTEMVDLTESPEKNKIKTHAGSPVSKYNDIKQESPQQLDHMGHFTTGIKSEPVSPRGKLVSQPVSMDIGIKSEPCSPTSESEPTTPDLLKKNVVYVKNTNENNAVEGEEIIIESDEENNVVMENEESVTINSDDERNSIGKHENNVVMENEEGVTIDSDDESNKLSRHEYNVVNKNEESITINSDDESSNIGRHVPQIDSDDVMMITPTKTPSKKYSEIMTVDSPMKIDSEDVLSPQRTPLKSIENVAKGLGSAVKLFGGQIASTISSIVSMVTPEQQKTAGKSRRKSVSQSPWLAKTPRSGKKNVIREELLISPDACRPLMNTSRKLVNIPLTSHAMTEARMNSTIMSAFESSPTPPSNHSVSSSRSSGSNSSDHGESLVGESPSPRKRFGSDLVQDSPLNDGNISKTFEESASLVLDSEQNTPAVINDSDVMNMSDVDSTPKGRPKVVQKIDDSMVDESDDERNNNESDEESNNEQIYSPIATSNRNKRKAVIESSDEESDNENGDESLNLNESEIDKDIGVTDEKVSKSIIDPLSDESDNDNNDETEDRSLSDESENESDKDDETENRKSRRKYSESKVRNKQFVEDESESGDEEYDEEDSFIDEVEESDETSEEEEDDFDNLSDVLKNQFSSYMTAGRSLYKKGNYNEALVNILQALEIYPHNEVQALAIKINKKIEGS